MAVKQTHFRRLATAARWPLGVGLTAWRYLWRTTPIHRDEIVGSVPEDLPPPIPGTLAQAGIQPLDEGRGCLFRRRYRTNIRGGRYSATELIARIAADPDSVAPSEFATFQKLDGTSGAMSVGDAYVVRMAGPWDGPVRVATRERDMFRLVTLDGHLEAGQIEFRARDEGELVVFEIESWARSKDWFTDLLYDRLRISKEVQLHMWTSTLERAARLSGGRMVDGIEIHTRKVDMDSPGVDAAAAAATGPRISFRSVARSPEGLRAKVASLADLKPNFAPHDLPAVARNAWHVDDYCQELPSEPPGDPIDQGPFEILAKLISTYEFADPSRVRAFYDVDRPLEGRDMLLEVRYLAIRVPVGVRVSQVFDEQRVVDDQPVRVWGWAYQTLEGHLECGQMDYQAWKWLQSGRVQFRIHAVSQLAPIDGPALRLGFRLIGRREQIEFARRCGERIDGLVRERLRGGAEGLCGSATRSSVR